MHIVSIGRDRYNEASQPTKDSYAGTKNASSGYTRNLTRCSEKGSQERLFPLALSAQGRPTMQAMQQKFSFAGINIKNTEKSGVYLLCLHMIRKTKGRVQHE